jgi:hypothetical protein
MEKMLEREREARKRSDKKLDDVMTMLQGKYNLKVPEEFEAVPARKLDQFPTDNISVLHDFVNDEGNWDQMDSHMNHCLNLVPDHHFLRRFLMVVYCSFLRRPLANNTTWGFAQ